MACEIGLLNADIPPGLVNTPYTWTIPFDAIPTVDSVAGSLPNGLTLDTGTMTISGTPTVAGTFGFIFNLIAFGCLSPIVSVPFTMVILTQGNPLTLDIDPLPTCIQKGFNYAIPVHVHGGLGPYTFTLPTLTTLGPGLGVASFVKPEYTAIEKVTSDDALLHFNIANAGTYYVEIDVVDRFGATSVLVVALVISDFCADKPASILGTSAKSTATMVKENWHQTNMINFLPEIMRK